MKKEVRVSSVSVDIGDLYITMFERILRVGKRAKVRHGRTLQRYEEIVRLVDSIREGCGRASLFECSPEEIAQFVVAVDPREKSAGIEEAFDRLARSYQGRTFLTLRFRVGTLKISKLYRVWGQKDSWMEFSFFSDRMEKFLFALRQKDSLKLANGELVAEVDLNGGKVSLPIFPATIRNLRMMDFLWEVSGGDLDWLERVWKSSGKKLIKEVGRCT